MIIKKELTKDGVLQYPLWLMYSLMKKSSLLLKIN